MLTFMTLFEYPNQFFYRVTRYKFCWLYYYSLFYLSQQHLKLLIGPLITKLAKFNHFQTWTEESRFCASCRVCQNSHPFLNFGHFCVAASIYTTSYMPFFADGWQWFVTDYTSAQPATFSKFIKPEKCSFIVLLRHPAALWRSNSALLYSSLCVN